MSYFFQSYFQQNLECWLLLTIDFSSLMVFFHTLLYFAKSWKFEWALVQTSFFAHMLSLCGLPYSWGLNLHFLLYYYILPVLFLFRQKSFCPRETYRYPYLSYLKERQKGFGRDQSQNLDGQRAKILSQFPNRSKNRRAKAQKTWKLGMYVWKMDLFSFCCLLWKVKCVIFLSSEDMLLQNICKVRIEGRIQVVVSRAGSSDRCSGLLKDHFSNNPLGSQWWAVKQKCMNIQWLKWQWSPWMLKDLHTDSFNLDSQYVKESYSVRQTHRFLSAQNQQYVLAPEICLFCISCTAICPLACAEKEQIFCRWCCTN